jgi:hypothetical protein
MMDYRTRLQTLKRLLPILLSTALLCTSLTTPVLAQAAINEIPTGKGSYPDLVELFDEFLAFRDSGDAEAGFSAPLVAQRREQMQQFQTRIDDMNVVSWDQARQVDYLAVRSRLNQYDFTLQRIRPWARDPGFYVDKMLWVTFTELPVAGEERAAFLDKIRAIPLLVNAAQKQLDDVAADYASGRNTTSSAHASVGTQCTVPAALSRRIDQTPLNDPAWQSALRAQNTLPRWYDPHHLRTTGFYVQDAAGAGSAGAAMAHLVALVPKPKVHLTRYHGAFAPQSKHRAWVTPAKRGKGNNGKAAQQQQNQTPDARRASISFNCV